MNRFLFLPALACGVGVPMVAQQGTPVDPPCCSAHANERKLPAPVRLEAPDVVTELVKGQDVLRLPAPTELRADTQLRLPRVLLDVPDAPDAPEAPEAPEAPVMRLDRLGVDAAGLEADELFLELPAAIDLEDVRVNVPILLDDIGVDAVGIESDDVLLNVPSITLDRLDAPRVIDLSVADGTDVLLLPPAADGDASLLSRYERGDGDDKDDAKARKHYEKALKDARKALEKAEKDFEKHVAKSRRDADSLLRDAQRLLEKQGADEDGVRLRRSLVAPDRLRARVERDSERARRRYESARERAEQSRERAERRLRARIERDEGQSRTERRRRDFAVARVRGRDADADVRRYIIRRDGTDEETHVAVAPGEGQSVYVDDTVIEFDPGGGVEVYEWDERSSAGPERADLDALLDDMRAQMSELRAEMRRLREQLHERRASLR